MYPRREWKRYGSTLSGQPAKPRVALEVTLIQVPVVVVVVVVLALIMPVNSLWLALAPKETKVGGGWGLVGQVAGWERRVCIQ